MSAGKPFSPICRCGCKLSNHAIQGQYDGACFTHRDCASFHGIEQPRPPPSGDCRGACTCKGHPCDEAKRAAREAAYVADVEQRFGHAPDQRDRLTARLTYLAVGLTDAGLSALVERAETLTVDHARPLTSGALTKAQQEREGALMQAALDVGAPDRTNNEGAENARRVEATARFEALKAEAAYEAGCPHHRDVPPGPCARCSWGHEAVEQAAPTAGKVEIPPWRPPCPVCKGAGRWEGWPCGACGNVGPVAAPKPQQGGL